MLPALPQREPEPRIWAKLAPVHLLALLWVLDTCRASLEREMRRHFKPPTPTVYPFPLDQGEEIVCLPADWREAPSAVLGSGSLVWTAKVRTVNHQPGAG